MHRITRSDDERTRLAEAARSTRDKRACLRIRALLLWDEGQNPTEVSRALGVGRQRLRLAETPPRAERSPRSHRYAPSGPPAAPAGRASIACERASPWPLGSHAPTVASQITWTVPPLLRMRWMNSRRYLSKS